MIEGAAPSRRRSITLNTAHSITAPLRPQSLPHRAPWEHSWWMKLISLFLIVGMLALNGWAEEKDFRGWKKGDWVKIDLDIEPYNHKMWEIDSVTKMDCSSLILLSHTIWARIHEVSSEHLLVTTYFVSRISFLDKAEELAKRKSNNPQVSPIKDKYSLETKQITEIREWPRGGEPPRPWWPL